MSVYRIVQESIHNVLKHAEAGEVLVRIEVRATTAEFTIQDDGKGFDMARTAPAGEQRGFGLLGLAERARLLGGTFTLQSNVGAGTTVSIRIPRPHLVPTIR